jgi:hypothetical protein
MMTQTAYRLLLGNNESYCAALNSPVAQSVQSLTTDWTAGVRSSTEAEDFSSNLCVQTGSGAHPASCTVGTGGSFRWGKSGRGVMLTTHPLLVQRLRKSRSYTSCHPNAPLRSVTGPLYLLLCCAEAQNAVYVNKWDCLCANVQQHNG